MKLKSVIISLISFVIIAVTGILLYVYWPAITGTINNSSYLTPEQGQEMYDKGYEDGNRAEEEQLAQIAYYRQITDDYYVQVGLLNNEISQLNGSIANKNETITELTNIKNTNLQTISDLNDTISANETTISNLNIQIIGLQSNVSTLQSEISLLNAEILNKQVIVNSLNIQISELQADITNNSNQITTLNSQIATLNDEIVSLQAQVTSKENTISYLNNQILDLQMLNTRLSQTNQSNANTITALNTQIVSLNNQISTLSYQLQNNSSSVTALNNRISELEDSIAYYEDFIAGLQDNTKVVATFMYDGSVYNVQVLNKNAYASVTNPTSTSYKLFNGWKVNGQLVNISSYSISANTTFVADITYKYDVTFVVDNATYDSQIVTANDYATLPTAPTKANYQFDGWTINGTTVVNPSVTVITANTTFTAKFTRVYTVTFSYDNATYTTQNVRSGEYASNVTVANTTYKIFNGWKLNGVIVDVTNTAITSNTTFIADITYKYDVTFVVDNTTYDSQIVIANGYATLPTIPTKANYQFDGWTINGTTIVNPSVTAIMANTTFTAKFTRVYTVTFSSDNSTYSTQIVRTGECASDVFIQSTVNKIFNGWKLNGVIVDVTNTVITSNTTFVADYTYRYYVTFVVDDQTYSSQVLSQNGYASSPTAPTKANKKFVGWSLDGVNVVSLNNYPITNDVIFYAVFGHELSGSWYYKHTDNSELTFNIYYSGLVNVKKLNSNGSVNFDVWTTITDNVNGIYTVKSVSGRFNNIDFALQDNKLYNQSFVNGIGDTWVILECTSIDLSQSYISPMTKQYTASGKTYNLYTNKEFKLYIGASMFPANGPHVIINDKIVCSGGGFSPVYNINTYELTDTYLTIGNKTYTFVQETGE